MNRLSTLDKDLSVHLIYHDPSDLGSPILIRIIPQKVQFILLFICISHLCYQSYSPEEARKLWNFEWSVARAMGVDAESWTRFYRAAVIKKHRQILDLSTGGQDFPQSPVQYQEAHRRRQKNTAQHTEEHRRNCVAFRADEGQEKRLRCTWKWTVTWVLLLLTFLASMLRIWCATKQDIILPITHLCA